MLLNRWTVRHWLGWLLLAVMVQAEAGQTPGYPSPWNGPWGNGFLSGESYNPLSNPYVGAGYPLAPPLLYGGAGPGGGYPMQQPNPMPQPRHLPGGGYLLPPGAGGGMTPGAYANH